MSKSIGFLYFLVLSMLPGAVLAGVVEKTVDFEHNGTKYKGYIYHDDAVSGKRPGVMVVHQWWGLTDYAKGRAKQLAEMGYVSFAMDMYGENKLTTHPEQAKEWMTQTTSNADAWRALANKGLDLLKANDKVDTSKLAAIGYCFGGSTVMQLAYSGADVKGVVSFHGSLPPASPEQAKAIKGKVLIEHGNADSFVPADRIAKFKAALDAANVDYTFHGYDGVRHAFTDPGADSRGIENLKYNADADKQSWSAMKTFFNQIFN
ncbi:MAG: dienelactone hydrolase family protein [Gammaproteobacteria bacterium]|nr:MAG: dienelactone hydrolase family protein [Gammaproteobacteria bacterium]